MQQKQSGSDSAGLTIGIFGLNGRVWLQGFRLALVVHGLHPEHVLVAFLKAFDGALGHVGFRPWDGHPAAAGLVHLLDDVAGDGLAAVIFRSLPAQFAAGFSNVVDQKWT